VKQESADPLGRLVRRDRMVWVSHPSVTLDASAPLPLIVYQAPSLTRTFAIRALESVGRTWRITCNVREVNGVLAAVRAGFGVAVFPQSLIPTDLVQVPSAAGLPEVGDVDFALVENPAAAREPVEALVSSLMDMPGQRRIVA